MAKGEGGGSMKRALGGAETEMRERFLCTGGVGVPLLMLRGKRGGSGRSKGGGWPMNWLSTLAEFPICKEE